MILTTSHEIEGKEVTEYAGIVTGEAIVGAHIIKDIFASLRDFFGGRSKSYEKTIRSAKDIALKEMQERAMNLGADAVISVDLDFQVLGRGNSMLMAVASGTAVKLSTRRRVVE